MLRLANRLAMECEEESRRITGQSLQSLWELQALSQPRPLLCGRIELGLCKDEGGQRRGLGSESRPATDHGTGQTR